MTIDQRLSILENQIAAMSVNTLAEGEPSGYYTSIYSGEQIDGAVGDVINGTVIIPSSTNGSSKRFQIKVDDSGEITAVEVAGE
jgi:hypothetical protein